MNWQLQITWRRAFETFCVFLAYFAAGRIGLAVPFTNGNVSPVWPAAGIALGAIVVFGRHVIPGIALGAFLVDLFTPVPPLAALGTGVGAALGPAIAAALLERKSITRIRRLPDVVYFVLLSALAMTVTAVIGPTALYLNGVHSWSGLPSASLVWWTGDCMGILLVAPLIINFADLKMAKLRLGELALLFLCLFAGTIMLLQRRTIEEEAYIFVMLPFIIWAAVRFSVAGAALANCLVAGVALWETAHGVGPFLAYHTRLYDVGVLQVFLAVLSLSGLCLAAVVAERTNAEEALAREKELRRAQDQYRMIIETTNDGVWIIDAEFRTTFVNCRMGEMLGYTPEEMIGRLPYDFLFPADVPQKRVDLERRRHGAGREVHYSRYRRKDGSEMWAILSTAPLLSENGQRIGSFAMLSDVTLLRRTEEALRCNEKLITAGRLAATISHEVNNPLEAVVNLLYLLKSEPMSTQAKGYLDLAEKEIQRVSAITRRTLGFCHDNSAWIEFSLADLLQDTLSFYEHRLIDNSIRVVRDFSDRGMVRASRNELQQVFAHLLSNALDAMGNGGVLTLRISSVTERGASTIQVSVEDTGPGIAADFLNRIFEPFFTTKPTTGTGLGLWVAMEIVHKHGGAISVTTKAGSEGHHGTKFCVLLPHTFARSAAA
jgi:PAS domain S-box-containing protein